MSFSEHLIKYSIITAGALIWGGIIWFLLQAGFFLFSGEWREFPFIKILGNLGSEWASAPHSWLGLHKLISYLSGPSVLIISGILIIWATGKMVDRP